MANLLTLGSRFRLALRNPLNVEKVLTKGANVASLLSSFRAKEIKKEGAQQFSIEVIKGGDRSQVKF